MQRLFETSVCGSILRTSHSNSLPEPSMLDVEFGGRGVRPKASSSSPRRSSQLLGAMWIRRPECALRVRATGRGIVWLWARKSTNRVQIPVPPELLVKWLQRLTDVPEMLLSQVCHFNPVLRNCFLRPPYVALHRQDVLRLCLAPRAEATLNEFSFVEGTAV